MFSLQHNCRVIDACMRMHNFIVDFHDATKPDIIEKDVFDNDCQQFLATNPGLDEGGVHGEEEDICQDVNGARSVGKRPVADDSNATVHRKAWRDSLRNEIAWQKFVCPRSNWFRENNHIVVN